MKRGENYRQELKGKKVLVVGLGKSGKAAVAALNECGADVSVQDSATADRLDTQFLRHMQNNNVKAWLGTVPEDMAAYDMLVLSPGVPADLDFIKEAERLIATPSYRESQGQRLYNAMIKPDQFNAIVAKTLETNQSQFPITEENIDYDSLDDRWYYLEKGGFRHAMPYVYGLLGPKDCLKYAPSVFFKKNLNRFFVSPFQRISAWLRKH